MSGETPLILQDLRAGFSIKAVSVKYRKTEGNIRKLAHRHHVEFRKPKQTQEERKQKKHAADARRSTAQKEIQSAKPPFQAAKLTGLAKCNDAWAKRVGCQRRTEDGAHKENNLINQKYGLRFPVFKTLH